MAKKKKKGKMDKEELIDKNRDKSKKTSNDNGTSPGKKSEEIDRISFLDSVRGAFIEPAMYKKFIRVKIKSAAAFIAILLLIVVLFYSLNLVNIIAKKIDNFAVFYRDNLPQITIKDGKAKVEGNIKMPLIVTYNDHGRKMPVIIDTTGKIKDLKEYETGLLLTEKELHSKESKDIYNVVPLSQYNKEFKTISEQSIRELKKPLFANYFPMIFVGWFFLRAIVLAIQILIFAWIGSTLARNKGINIDFRAMINLCIYASVPALIILMILDVAGAFRILSQLIASTGARLFSLILYYSIFLIYLVTAVKSVAPVPIILTDSADPTEEERRKSEGIEGL